MNSTLQSSARFRDKDVFALTPRESEVLDLICLGMSNAAIAAELGIGVGSVKTHVRNLLSKQNVKNREQLIAKQLSNLKATIQPKMTIQAA